jgi:hypothetical protein
VPVRHSSPGPRALARALSDQDHGALAAPFAPHLTFRIYEPEIECAASLADRPTSIGSRITSRPMFRILILHNYGGVYDMDMASTLAR